MALVRPETPQDYDAIHEINTLAFGLDNEAVLTRGLRDGGYAILSLVAEVDGEPVGHCMFSRIKIGETDALALAPVSVLPDHQKKGIGRQLIEHGLKECKDMGEERVTVLGNPDYYPRFGFTAELTKNIEHDFPPHAYMAVELVPGSMQGVKGKAIYPPPFGID